MNEAEVKAGMMVGRWSGSDAGVVVAVDHGDVLVAWGLGGRVWMQPCDLYSLQAAKVTPMARCPGCLDRGDVEHIAACAGAKLRSSFRSGVVAGVDVVRTVIGKQLRRRGKVDLAGVEAKLANLNPGDYLEHFLRVRP